MNVHLHPFGASLWWNRREVYCGNNAFLQYFCDSTRPSSTISQINKIFTHPRRNSDVSPLGSRFPAPASAEEARRGEVR